MVTKEMILEAKQVPMLAVLDAFDWKTDSTGQFILCPSAEHDDKHPSVAINYGNNTCTCFSCWKNGRGFDTISVYQCLSEKVNGKEVPFPQAVEEILQLDSTAVVGRSHMKYVQNSEEKREKYEKFIQASKQFTKYEISYLNDRGIFLFSSWVYQGKVYSVQNVQDALKMETDPLKIKELMEIQQNGKFYRGILSILKKNKINVRHIFNPGNKVNSIIYYVKYDYDNDEELQGKETFFVGTSRDMAVVKGMDTQHNKITLGNSDFYFITEGLGTSKDVYICEGIEDALTYCLHGKKAISLNSTTNMGSLIDYLEGADNWVRGHRFILNLDNDKGGQKATAELVKWFEEWNSKHPQKQYEYAICNVPQGYKDINDYWVDKVFSNGR